MELANPKANELPDTSRFWLGRTGNELAEIRTIRHFSDFVGTSEYWLCGIPASAPTLYLMIDAKVTLPSNELRLASQGVALCGISVHRSAPMPVSIPHQQPAWTASSM